MGAMLTLASRSASADPWSIEPRLGISADYNTNPALVEFNPRAEDHVAALLNVPLRYDGDSTILSLTPSARIGDSSGYSSLASNYTHVLGNAQFVNSRGSTSVQAEWLRDSSLYHVGGLVNGLGVRRDTALTSIDWNRSLTERSQLDLNAGWTRVQYAQNETLLTDYHYLTGGPSFGYALDERDTLRLLGNVGHYQSLNGLTESRSENLQLGLVRQLTELWSLTATAGYSRSTNTQKIFFGPFFLGSTSSSLNGAIYAATLSRQGEQLNFSGEVSRSLQPTGFAFLSRQDTVNITSTYKRTERWNFSLSAVWDRALNPSLGALGVAGPTNDVHYVYAQLTAEWHWTSEWIIAMHARRVAQQSEPARFSTASSGVSIDIVRQFLRMDL
jgi:hypothetical protein